MIDIYACVLLCSANLLSIFNIYYSHHLIIHSSIITLHISHWALGNHPIFKKISSQKNFV